MAKGGKTTKRKSGRKVLENFTRNAPTNEYKGVRFTFEDETLQESYIQAQDKFKILEINWYEPVTYNMATSIAYKGGNMRKELDKLLDRYEAEDNNYSKGSLHKDKIFDKVRSQYESLTPLQQIKKLNAFFDKVEEKTEEWNENHKKNNGQQKYNIVFYSTDKDGSSKGSKSPV